MRSTKWTNKWWGEYQANLLSVQIRFSIIANRVGAESYENFSDDNMLNFKYEGTIRRQSGDLLRIGYFYVIVCFSNHSMILWSWFGNCKSPNDTMRSQSRGSLSSRASDLSYQQGYNSRRVASPSQAPSHAADSGKFSNSIGGSHAHQSEQFENC